MALCSPIHLPIGSGIRSITHALVQTGVTAQKRVDAFKDWLGSWKGASQSVLDGVQTRDGMDSYIHRAGAAATQQ